MFSGMRFSFERSFDLRFSTEPHIHNDFRFDFWKLPGFPIGAPAKTQFSSLGLGWVSLGQVPHAPAGGLPCCHDE